MINLRRYSCSLFCVGFYWSWPECRQALEYDSLLAYLGPNNSYKNVTSNAILFYFGLQAFLPEFDGFSANCLAS